MTMNTAVKYFKHERPNLNVQNAIEMNGLCYILAYENPGEVDPFYSVNLRNGEIKNVLPFTLNDPKKFLDMIGNSERQEDR